MGYENVLRVNTMYGVDGRLRTSYFENEAAVVAARNVKAFHKELAKYEKDFAEYASLDIDESKLLSTNARFIFGKLDIADSYVEFVSDEDMVNAVGDETAALVSNKNSYKLGIGARLANKFRPFFEKQAEKHPRLQVLSDRMTQAANGGRMPLTADSAAVMRIAFDKKFYNDCRKPDVNINELREQHSKAIKNLTTMAMLDGVSKEELSNAFNQKLITQMRVDETLTDIYAGMANGDIRLADSEPFMGAENEAVRVANKTLYENPVGFVSAEKDENGVNKALDAWDFKPREPQSIEDIISDYQTKLDAYAHSCNNAKEFETMLCSDSYRNLERNAKVFAEADCPDDAAKFKHEFARCNLMVYKNWAINHGMADVYDKLRIPAPYDEYIKGNTFAENYSTDNYDIERNSVYKAAMEKQKVNLSKEEIAKNTAIECEGLSEELCDKDAYLERLAALEAENKLFKEVIEKLNNVEAENRELKTAIERQSELEAENKALKEAIEKQNKLEVENRELKDALARSSVDASKDVDALAPVKAIPPISATKSVAKQVGVSSVAALAEAITSHTQSRYDDLDKPILASNNALTAPKQAAAIEAKSVALDTPKVENVVPEKPKMAPELPEVKTVAPEQAKTDEAKTEQQAVADKETAKSSKALADNPALQAYNSTKSEISKYEKSIVNAERNVAKGIELKNSYDRVYNKIADSVRKEAKENGTIAGKDKIKYYLVDKDMDLRFIWRDEATHFHDGTVNVKANSVIGVGPTGYIFLPPDHERGKLCENESRLSFNMLRNEELANLTPISKKQYERVLDGAVKKDDAFKTIKEKVIEFNKNREMFCQKLNALHEKVKPFEAKFLEISKNVSSRNVSRYDLPSNAPTVALPGAEPSYALG